MKKGDSNQGTPLRIGDCDFNLDKFTCFFSYRRLEWTANKLDSTSVQFAKKFGLSFEGVFRNYGVVKGRNRDLAWFSITNQEWELLQGSSNRVNKA